MDLEEKTREILVNFFINTINCSKEEAKMITENLTDTLEENNFMILYNWENEV